MTLFTICIQQNSMILVKEKIMHVITSHSSQLCLISTQIIYCINVPSLDKVHLVNSFPLGPSMNFFQSQFYKTMQAYQTQLRCLWVVMCGNAVWPQMTFDFLERNFQLNSSHDLFCDTSV